MSDHELRTPVSLTSVSEDDPHMQPKAKDPQAVERRIAILFLLGIFSFCLFGAAYWQNAKAWTYGATLGGGMLFLGVGLVAWGKYLMAQGPFMEERHPHRGTDEERDSFAAALVERGGGTLQRRKVLGGLLGGGLGVFTIVAMFPLLRSLGPLPKKSLTTTDWQPGTYVVDVTGRRIHSDDMTVGSLVTVFPEGTTDNPDQQAIDQTVMIRVRLTDWTTQAGRETWGPQGYIAYSKLCTHLGCPVGLYEQQLQLLVCPCHQSMFNVMNGAIPQFGPAPRPLPQLPLYVDSAGYLRAQGGYDQPVGPGYWERS
jgi:ubiquinol-cytochrome c reductase iron-sulfur subunit